MHTRTHSHTHSLITESHPSEIRRSSVSYYFSNPSKLVVSVDHQSSIRHNMQQKCRIFSEIHADVVVLFLYLFDNLSVYLFMYFIYVFEPCIYVMYSLDCTKMSRAHFTLLFYFPHISTLFVFFFFFALSLFVSDICASRSFNIHTNIHI